MARKGENIYRRKDGRWEARYIIGHKPDGKPRYGYLYAHSYKAARKMSVTAKAGIGRPVPSCRENQFAAYCDEWLRINRARVKESTYVKYLSMMEKHIKPALGGCKPREITALSAEGFTRELYGKGLSVKRVRDILTLLRSVLRYTEKETGVPTAEIILPGTEKKPARVLTVTEQTRFTEYLLRNTDACKFGVLLAMFTGLRIGEICALKWADISLSERTLTVSSSMQRLKDTGENAKAKTKIVIGKPKTANSARVIPLTDYMYKLCMKHRKEPGAYILTGTERYMEPRTLQYRLSGYTKACGLAGVHFHVLRHTFATRCAEGGCEIKSLSEILGHTSPNFTLERYVHSSLQAKRENMEKIALLFAPSQSPSKTRKKSGVQRPLPLVSLST